MYFIYYIVYYLILLVYRKPVESCYPAKQYPGIYVLLLLPY
jgi:hypothetical protein